MKIFTFFKRKKLDAPKDFHQTCEALLSLMLFHHNIAPISVALGIEDKKIITMPTQPYHNKEYAHFFDCYRSSVQKSLHQHIHTLIGQHAWPQDWIENATISEGMDASHIIQEMLGGSLFPILTPRTLSAHDIMKNTKRFSHILPI